MGEVLAFGENHGQYMYIANTFKQQTQSITCPKDHLYINTTCI